MESPAPGACPPEHWMTSGARHLQAIDLKTLHAKIAQQTLENDFLEGALDKTGLLSVKK